MSAPAAHLEPLVLAEAAAACGVPEPTLDLAVALALRDGGPDAAAPGWRGVAPCAGLDPSTFYPRRHESTAEISELCAGCPVKAPCLGLALYHGEREGWWGGTSPGKRQALRKVLRRAGVMGVTGEDAYLAWREDDADPAEPTPVVRAPAAPWPHQLEAVEAVRAELAGGGTCQIAMATASGKTLVAVWAATALGAERVLVLVPALSLIAQSADVWAADPRWAGVRRLAVCSDTGELDLDATTDPAEVRAFLAAPGPALVFATCQSGEVLAEAGCRFDLTVADEAHHLAGEAGKAFAGVVRGEILTDRTLYMTATPRRFRRRRDSDLVGMDDEAFGPRVFDFPLSEAVAAGVVADYRVIVAAVDGATFERVARLPELRGIDPHLLAGAIAVVRAMGEMDLGSCVSFHSRVDRARTFAQLVGTVADALAVRPPHHGWAGFCHGDTSVRIRRRLLARLADERTWGVLANARALGEGVDVPTLDAVAIVDPKNSEQDVMQACGRALRRPTARKVGTVLLPVLMEGNPDPADPLAGLDQRSLDLVAGVLRALRGHDNELAGHLDRTRRYLGRRGTTGGDFGAALRRRAARGLLRSRVELHVPGGATGALAGAMALHLIREATPRWDEGYGRLLEYVAEHGAIPGLVVVEDDERGHFKLGQWCNVQRTLYRRGVVAPERAERLEAIPVWSWEPREEGWWAKFEALRDFMVAEGRDPRAQGAEGGPDWYRGVNLGQFLNSCRAARTDHDDHWLTRFPDRIAALEAIPGWCWNVKDRQWEESFTRLERFAAQTGHASPTRLDLVDGQNMGHWVMKQRARILDGSLRDDRIQRLRALPGWRDSGEYAEDLETSWERAYRMLQAFVRAYKRLPHQQERFAGFTLGRWVHGQRNRSSNSPARIRRLEAVPGWTWDAMADVWPGRLSELREYATRHHVPGRPLRFPEHSRLSDWATTQRSEHARGRLASERAAALEAVPGWVWNVWDAKAELAAEAVRAWLEREGAVDPVTTHRENDVPVRAWIRRWRQEHAAGDMDPEWAGRLEAIPRWSWDPLPVQAQQVQRDPETGQYRVVS